MKADEDRVSDLITQLQSDDSDVRESAAEALGEIGDPCAVDPLIATLKDEDSGVREHAAYALGDIGDPRAVDPLITALKDENSDVRRTAAYALGEIKDPRAVDRLLAAVNARDLLIVAGAYRFFIRKGNPEWEDVLIDALNEFGNETMAEDYINCGNPRLKSAGESFAKANDYEISSTSTSSCIWGSESSQ